MYQYNYRVYSSQHETSDHHIRIFHGYFLILQHVFEKPGFLALIRRLQALQGLLQELILDPETLQLYWLSK